MTGRDQPGVVTAVGPAACRVGRELLWYADRLAEPWLLGVAIVTGTGLIAVPVTTVRRAGTVQVDGIAGAKATMELLAEYNGFPDLRMRQCETVVLWGAELPVSNVSLLAPEIARTDAAVGRVLGYTESAIRLHLTRRVGPMLAEAVLRDAQ